MFASTAPSCVTGYAQPFFKNLKFEALPKDHSGLAALWASLVNGVKDVLENREDAVATTVPITGHYTDPTIDFWSAIFGLLSNAFLQALARGFESPEIAPSPSGTAGVSRSHSRSRGKGEARSIGQIQSPYPSRRYATRRYFSLKNKCRKSL